MLYGFDEYVGHRHHLGLEFYEVDDGVGGGYGGAAGIIGGKGDFGGEVLAADVLDNIDGRARRFQGGAEGVGVAVEFERELVFAELAAELVDIAGEDIVGAVDKAYAVA